MADWAYEKAEAVLGTLNAYIPDIAAALREAREPREKEIAALHDLLGQAWALLDPQEHPDLCEVICDTLDCGTDGKPTPCTHYQQAIDRAYEDGREQGAREERRECFKTVFGADTWVEARMRIAARGPMSQEGGGE